MPSDENQNLLACLISKLCYDYCFRPNKTKKDNLFLKKLLNGLDVLVVEEDN